MNQNECELKSADSDDDVHYSLFEAMDAGVTVIAREMMKRWSILIAVLFVFVTCSALTFVRPWWLAMTGASVAALIVAAILCIVGVEELDALRIKRNEP